MGTKVEAGTQSENLRRRAEGIVKQTGVRLERMPAEDVRRLAHELQVHKIELELQNEQLWQAQLELQNSRDRYRDLFSAAPVGYLSLDRTGKIQEATLTLTEMLGAARAGLHHQPLAHFVARANHDTFLQHCQQVFTGEGKGVCELQLLKSDGTTLHACLESVAVNDENGERTSCRTAVINISERKELEEALERTYGGLEQRVKERTAALSMANEELQQQVAERLQAEEALRRQERFLAHILASIQDGISVLDTDLTIRHVNDAMNRWYGPKTPLVGKKCHLCYHGSDKPCDPCPTLRSIRSGQTERDVVPGLPGSSAEWLELFSYPIKDDVTGEVTGVVEFVRDITSREQAKARREQLEAQLRQAQTMEAIGQLAGGVAHDFNNILTSILANLGLLLAQLSPDTPENTELLRRLRAIERGAQRAAELTGQLLAFSRRQVTQPRTLNLNETLASSKELLRRLIPENIELEVVLEPGAGNVRADPGQIEQVVMNLIANARDAMAQGGKLTLETANVVLDQAYVTIHPEVQPGPHVMLAVKDTGCGMDAETAERIFKPFFTTKPRGRGTGLGLATVYGIVMQAGGSIDVDTTPGLGTTLRIYFPAVVGSVAQSPTTPDDTDITARAETVLVCEDEDEVRKLAVEVLQRAGYMTLSASNGAAALAIATEYQRPIQLLLTDVVMPGMDGRKLAELMTSARPDLRALLMSGYPSDVIAHHGVLEEGVQFLQKPFTNRALLKRIREVLDGQQCPKT